MLNLELRASVPKGSGPLLGEEAKARLAPNQKLHLQLQAVQLTPISQERRKISNIKSKS